MTPEQVAYVAGVLDALARVRVHETDGGTLLPTVAVSSPNLDLLRHMAELTGVSVTIVRRNYDRLGCTEHCQEKHLHVTSHTGRWSLVGARADVVLKACRPHLVMLGRDVDQVLAQTAGAPRKPATVAKMRRLGWAV